MPYAVSQDSVIVAADTCRQRCHAYTPLFMLMPMILLPCLRLLPYAMLACQYATLLPLRHYLARQVTAFADAFAPCFADMP